MMRCKLPPTLDVTSSFLTISLGSSSTKKQQASAHSSVKDYLQLACQPVETAVCIGDDITNLLVALGATVDVGIKRSMHTYASPHERLSLADWFDFAINDLDELIENKMTEMNHKMQEDKKQTEHTKTPEGATGWKAFRGKYLDDLTFAGAVGAEVQERIKAQQVRQRQQAIDRLNDTKDFLVDIRGTLTEHDAKTWNKIYPTSESEAKPPKRGIYQPYQNTNTEDAQTNGYVFINNTHYRRQYVPKHLVEAYDELYEACFTGDNAKIQHLCLPIDGQDAALGDGPVPLNISVRQIDATISAWDGCGETDCHYCG